MNFAKKSLVLIFVLSFYSALLPEPKTLEVISMGGKEFVRRDGATVPALLGVCSALSGATFGLVGCGDCLEGVYHVSKLSKDGAKKGSRKIGAGMIRIVVGFGLIKAGSWLMDICLVPLNR